METKTLYVVIELSIHSYYADHLHMITDNIEECYEYVKKQSKPSDFIVTDFKLGENLTKLLYQEIKKDNN